MKYIVIDERISAAAEAKLEELGFTVFKLPAHRGLSPAVRSHTDMLFLRLGEVIFTPREYRDENPELLVKLEAALAPLRFIYTEDALGSEYPADAKLNCLVMGKRLFCNKKTLSPEVLEYAEATGYKIIGVKQGYPACTALPIGEDTAITADRGMARALSSAGIRVITVEDTEGISLPPHKFGFIGGCCHRFGNEYLFFGNAERYEFFPALSRAIEERGGKIISLDPYSDRLFDLGGATSYEKSI